MNKGQLIFGVGFVGMGVAMFAKLPDNSRPKARIGNACAAAGVALLGIALLLGEEGDAPEISDGQGGIGPVPEPAPDDAPSGDGLVEPMAEVATDVEPRTIHDGDERVPDTVEEVLGLQGVTAGV